MEFCLQCAREILSRLDHPAGTGSNEQGIPGASLVSEGLGSAIRSAEDRVAAMLAAQSQADWRRAVCLRMTTQEAMARLSCQVTALLEPTWRSLVDRPQVSLVERDEKILEWGNLFVASRVVDLLRQAFPQMRVLSGSAMAGVLAMMLAASVYPFVQRDLLLWVSWIVLLTAIAIGVVIFVQISRSRIVSMLNGTTPGRFSWDSAFTMRILIFGVLPIVTLLGAQYPNALGGIISWIGSLFGGAPAQ
jgi:hypothetical protein